MHGFFVRSLCLFLSAYTNKGVSAQLTAASTRSKIFPGILCKSSKSLVVIEKSSSVALIFFAFTLLMTHAHLLFGCAEPQLHHCRPLFEEAMHGTRGWNAGTVVSTVAVRDWIYSDCIER